MCEVSIHLRTTGYGVQAQGPKSAFGGGLVMVLTTLTSPPGLAVTVHAAHKLSRKILTDAAVQPPQLPPFQSAGPVCQTDGSPRESRDEGGRPTADRTHKRCVVWQRKMRTLLHLPIRPWSCRKASRKHQGGQVLLLSGLPWNFQVGGGRAAEQRSRRWHTQ